MKKYKINDFIDVPTVEGKEDVEFEGDIGIFHIQCGDAHGVFSTFNIDSARSRWLQYIKKDKWLEYPEFHAEYRLGEKAHINLVERVKDPRDLRLRTYQTKLELIEKGITLLNPDIVHVHDTIVPVRYQKTIKNLLEAIKCGRISEKHVDALINTSI